MHVRARAHARACARGCARARVCVRACVCVCAPPITLRGTHALGVRCAFAPRQAAPSTTTTTSMAAMRSVHSHSRYYYYHYARGIQLLPLCAGRSGHAEALWPSRLLPTSLTARVLARMWPRGQVPARMWAESRRGCGPSPGVDWGLVPARMRPRHGPSADVGRVPARLLGPEVTVQSRQALAAAGRC